MDCPCTDIHVINQFGYYQNECRTCGSRGPRYRGFRGQCAKIGRMEKPKIVIAIDDCPERYQTLARSLKEREILLVTVQNPEAVLMLLDWNPIGILLDHDMPNWDGQYYAREILREKNIPVCITSANHSGAKQIANILKETEVPCKIISVLETSPEERWIGWILSL